MGRTNDLLDNWHSTSTFQRDSRLVNGTLGTSMASGGSCVGSSLSIPDYQAGKLAGNGQVVVPAMTSDVQANLNAHNGFHTATWFSFGCH